MDFIVANALAQVSRRQKAAIASGLRQVICRQQGTHIQIAACPQQILANSKGVRVRSPPPLPAFFLFDKDLPVQHVGNKRKRSTVGSERRKSFGTAGKSTEQTQPHQPQLTRPLLSASSLPHEGIGFGLAPEQRASLRTAACSHNMESCTSRAMLEQEAVQCQPRGRDPISTFGWTR